MDWARPRLCAAIVKNDIKSIKSVEPMVDFFEVRIDLLGKDWKAVAKRLEKPWIACNRRVEEGGKWRGDDSARTDELLDALEMGAAIIDIELDTPGLENILNKVKPKADCLVSYHNLEDTLPLEEMHAIIKRQLAAGADIAKVVTTARGPADNIAVLQLIRDFPEEKIIAFAMGGAGQTSRVLCPLVGGYFTYASVKAGRESAAGQLSVGEMVETYRLLEATGK